MQNSLRLWVGFAALLVTFVLLIGFWVVREGGDQ